MSKTMIGLDPLAWLSPDKSSAASKKKKAKKKPAKKKVIRKKAKNKVAKKKLSKKKVVRKKVAAKDIISKQKTPAKKMKPVVVEKVEQPVSTPKIETQVVETETNETVENPVMGSVIKLNDIQDISQVAELQQKIVALMNNTDIIFDGGEVERIDAASLQLLTCAFKQAEKYGSKVSWQASSDALKKSAEFLGLKEELRL